jgi:hypothetical protein
MLVKSQITLDKNAGIPEIVTVIGNANYGGYDLYLWDSPTHYETIGGNDGSQPNNRFSLRHPPADLVTRRLVWEGKLRPLGTTPNLPFSVTCLFYQNNTPVTAYDVQPKAAGNFSATFELVVIICTFKIT